VKRAGRRPDLNLQMASDIRAAFEKKSYKFADDGLDERCASLASSHDMSAEEMALEFESVMLKR
jgi:hypothetical protein